jgi:hypothetical protein
MKPRVWSLGIGTVVALGFAAPAMADEAGAVRTHSLQVVERLAVLERIDVTAEKAPSEHGEAIDDELMALLDEVEALEHDAVEAAKAR